MKKTFRKLLPLLALAVAVWTLNQLTSYDTQSYAEIADQLTDRLTANGERVALQVCLRAIRGKLRGKRPTFSGRDGRKTAASANPVFRTSEPGKRSQA